MTRCTMVASPDRARALEAALSQIDRQFGKGSIMRLGDEGRAPVEVLDRCASLITQPHDRPLAELTIDLAERGLEGPGAIRGSDHGAPRHVESGSRGCAGL